MFSENWSGGGSLGMEVGARLRPALKGDEETRATRAIGGSNYTNMKQTEREIEIGERLRKFRESKMIPRTRMAVALKIGNERLASYESGRAPLQYSIFREIMRQFGVSPYWLATGESQPVGPAIDDSPWVKTLRRRAKFS